MNTAFRKVSLLTLIHFCLFTVFAQASNLWTALRAEEVRSMGKPDIQTSSVLFFGLDHVQMRSALLAAPMENQGAISIELPAPDGRLRSFNVFRTPIVHPQMQEKYPFLLTLAGTSTDGHATIYLDMTAQGFHAMVLDAGASYFIDPYNRSTTDVYQVYWRKDAIAGSDIPACGFSSDPEKEVENVISADRRPGHSGSGLMRSNGLTLRTYRAAIACTGEYSAFHGGTVAGALSAIVTSLNRVSGVYETELSIRMTLIPNNDTVIFLNPATDPYSNNSGGTMLGQNQTTMTSYIGSSNYDIGHVFSTGGGGIAGLGVICSASQKARGVTGSGSPVGDPFDIDYVAHEIGHQFGANHTFNGNAGGCSGNINPTTAYEPGSGTTIMAYAGLCSPQNTQNFSDPYFHTVSFDEIIDYVTLSTGSICPVNTPTGNTPPVITSTGGDHAIPCSTAFMLEGMANDPDGDTLLFCWEQFDLGPAGSPTTPSGNAPLFRSFNPTLSPVRFFPKLPSLVTNTLSAGERLPTYDRSITFRLTARDNRVIGGGVTYEDVLVTLTAVNTGAPFLVTSPNTAVSWIQGSQENVTWNVSGTDLAPINTSTVDIYLSLDGGFTYPQVLAAGVPNNGQATVTVPPVSTIKARVMVKGAGNVFFDISNVNFTISAPLGNIDPLELETIRVHPNPAGASTTVSLAGPYTGELWLILTDMAGRSLQSNRLQKSGSGLTHLMDLSGLGQGVYFITIKTEDHLLTYKLFVGDAFPMQY